MESTGDDIVRRYCSSSSKFVERRVTEEQLRG